MTPFYQMVANSPTTSYSQATSHSRRDIPGYTSVKSTVSKVNTPQPAKEKRLRVLAAKGLIGLEQYGLERNHHQHHHRGYQHE